MLHVFIGYDPREHDAYSVCELSIKRRSSEPVTCIPLKQSSLRNSGLYSRRWTTNAEGQRIDLEDNTPFSTEFSFTRFLVPELMRRNNLHTTAMFVDCDFLFLDDVAILFEEFECQPPAPVGVVQHNYIPASRRKMDNCEQVPYNRKLWSALMLFRPWHSDCMKLTPEVVNKSPGSYLHQFQWTDDANITPLSERWQWIPGVSPTTGIEPLSKPSAIHYTEGGPWFENYKDVPFAEEWNKEFKLVTEGRFNWKNAVTL